MHGRAFITLVAIAELLICSELQAQAGQINGVVTDEAGSPVAHAQVSPQLKGVYVRHTLRTIVKTDDKGRFEVDGLRMGEYAVYAFKEDEGYPDISIPLYRTRPAPGARLSADHPTANVNVVIGPKGGIVRASVRDAVTHAPLPSQLVLQKADGSAMVYLSEAPDFQVLLPADTEVLLEVRVEGYKPWVYASGGRSTMRLKSGEYMRIEVEAMPMEKAQERDSKNPAILQPASIR
jgi:hypothetical protein